MKITNGSPPLASKVSIGVTLTDIRIGEDKGAQNAAMVFVAAVISGMFIPGPWWIYWVLGGLLAWAINQSTADSRLRYTAEQIEKVQMLGLDRVGTKGTGGSLGSAALGGAIFGGVGAVVGSIAGGNEIEEFKNIAIKFTDGEWVVVEAEKGKKGEIELQNLLKLAGTKNECPI